MNETILIIAMLIASVGILLYFVGWINTIFMALGKNEKLTGVILFLVSPLAILYCIKNWNDAATQGKQLLTGVFIMACTILPAYIYYSKLIII